MMLNNIKIHPRLLQNSPFYTNCRFCNSLTHLEKKSDQPTYEIIDTRNIPTEDEINFVPKKNSVLEPCTEDVSHVAPYLKPSFNFAAYVNKSETLQELVKLGVDLSKLEKKAEVPPYLLRLEFERDIKNHVVFLHDLGLQIEEIGHLVTKNPFIFKEDLNDLQVRINYLKSKKFDDEMIRRIVSKNPYWLSLPTQKIDDYLGFFQKQFHLSGSEVRLVATRCPKLITYGRNNIKLNIFTLKEEMCFSEDELKQILLTKPGIFKKSKQKLLQAFEYLHKEMKIPSEFIVKFPEVLTQRLFRLKQRHLFLKQLNRAQYDPLKPNYVSLLAITTETDAHFATEVAKSTIQTFNIFLKTL